MAIYRTVSMSFWTDRKVTDEFTAEDKYFYLYLFTNPHTNLCGCYEISIKQIANEMGYSKDSVENLLKRFETTHKVLKFSKETGEVLLLNWHKYNWTSSEKFRKPLAKEIASVKNTEFKSFLSNAFEGKDTVYIPYAYGSDTSVTDIYINIIKDIILYFNNKLNTNYKYNSKVNQKHIRARLNEGYTFDDFKEVIDKKYEEWNGTDMAKYLRPETLFGTKFESYLNQKNLIKSNTQEDIKSRLSNFAKGGK